MVHDEDGIAPFSFATAGEIRFGRGRAEGAAEAAAWFGQQVVLVHGRDPQRAAWLREALDAEGLEVTAIACTGEPDLPMLEAALDAARSAAPASILALGGGSAIDLAKALAGLVPAAGPVLDHLEVVGKGLPLTEDPLPLLAVPTTAGTGAEVTRNAVIGVPEHRRKVSLRDGRLIPRIAIIDPALTDGCPRDVTLASGLDALTQTVEPWLSLRSNPMTDALCSQAIPMALDALPRLMSLQAAPEAVPNGAYGGAYGGAHGGAYGAPNGGTNGGAYGAPNGGTNGGAYHGAASAPGTGAGLDACRARDAMSWVSLAGGLALANAGLGAVHGLAGVIGGLTGAAHGAICGALLPHVLAANRAALDPLSPAGRRLALLDSMLGRAFGASGDTANVGFDALERWSQTAGLPRLSALGLSVIDHAKVAHAAGASSSMKSNPVALSPIELSGILARAG
ncbi:MAG: iron-containing alcohol dehydrogenase [Pseudomonadota bacterium]